jgi:hypothetical protein
MKAEDVETERSVARAIADVKGIVLVGKGAGSSSKRGEGIGTDAGAQQNEGTR